MLFSAQNLRVKSRAKWPELCRLCRARASASCARFACFRRKKTWWGHWSRPPPNRDFAVKSGISAVSAESPLPPPLRLKGEIQRGLHPKGDKHGIDE
jgi:hypothetical protein